MTQLPSTSSPGPFLEWKTEYEIGIRRFDEEHARLAAFINHLHSTMIVRRDKGVSLQVFDRLITETRRHFDAETAVMIDVGYPVREVHEREHEALLGQANHLREQYDQGNISALALPAFLMKWLLHHIEESDRPYVGFFRGHGIP